MAATAAAADVPGDAVLKLRRAGELTCRPALPVFCTNMHVSCAGRTTIATSAFKLRLARAGGAVEATAPYYEPLVPYGRATAQWDETGASVLLLPNVGGGYIRLTSDGKYAFRHYPGPEGVMSLCQPLVNAFLLSLFINGVNVLDRKSVV